MTHASHYFEIEVDLSGSYTPGYRGDATCPPEDAWVQDVDVEGVFALRYVRPTPGNGNALRWQRFDLLQGVDPKSEAYQQIKANMLAFMGDEAAEAVLHSYQDRAA